MDPKEIIINMFILTATVVVPITLLIRSATKANSMLKKEIIKLNNTLPTVNDIWLKRAIAIDSNRMSYVNLISNEKFLIDLAQMTDCSILLNSDEIVTRDRDISAANTLDIVLVEKGLKNKFIKVNFYDTHQDEPVQANHHLQLALKWKKIIQERIQAKKTVNS